MIVTAIAPKRRALPEMEPSRSASGMGLCAHGGDGAQSTDAHEGIRKTLFSNPKSFRAHEPINQCDRSPIDRPRARTQESASMKNGDGRRSTSQRFAGPCAWSIFATAIVVPACGNGSNASREADGAPTSSTDAGATESAVGLDASASQPLDGGSSDATTHLADAAQTIEASSFLPDGAIDPCGPNNTATVPLPTIGSGTFDVRTYGAVGDGVTNDTTALQAALTAAGNAGGGTVVVPTGTFLSGPIVVSSGTDLELESGAELEMLPMSSYPGTTAFITANNAHDIALTGSGTIEGQG
jgi:hypothetical protein